MHFYRLYLIRSKKPVQVRGPEELIIPPAPHPSVCFSRGSCPWVHVPFLHNSPPYLEAFSSIRNLRMRHAVVTRAPGIIFSQGYSSRHQIARFKAPEGLHPPPHPQLRGAQRCYLCYVANSELSLLAWAPLFVLQRCTILLWPWSIQFGDSCYNSIRRRIIGDYRCWFQRNRSTADHTSSIRYWRKLEKYNGTVNQIGLLIS
jgi:hypothetical protein